MRCHHQGNKFIRTHILYTMPRREQKTDTQQTIQLAKHNQTIRNLMHAKRKANWETDEQEHTK